MMHFNFNKWNTILGWLVFLIAAIVYGLTIEPTVSFWDAGEYILTASKLQVGHPPGAPLFQMMGALFSMFALEPSQIGMIMNLMSGVASAFTIAFMFWTITLLLQKLVNFRLEPTKSKALAILGSGLVGSLAFTFTDSFWFNAVETEVYAMATLIMAVLFYLALRWEQDMDTPRGHKWLLLIAFIIGLSFGVHFMGLLTIPAIGLIYFFKNYKTITVKNFIIANVASAAVLLFIFKVLLPSTLKLFGYLEVFFVNSLGLPFNSGTIFTGLLIIAAIYFGLRFTRQKGWVYANTLTLCLLFILVGFSSWVMLPIRANANVIINENNPSDARELLAYYNLEQYPETHLFYGPLFTEVYSGADKNEPFIDNKKNYERNDTLGKYEIINDWEKTKQNYNHEHASLLPRMWSADHAANYMRFTGPLNFEVKADFQKRVYNEALNYGLSEEQASQYAAQEKMKIDQMVFEFKKRANTGIVDYDEYASFLSNYGQQYLDIEKPSFFDNMSYMIRYQFGYMYFRYFMWNFTGRQNDIQGELDDFNGNWISGIKFIDESHLGIPQSNLPSDVAKNKARNTYYFLPLILGIIGLIFLFYKDKKWFWVLLVFFLMTGLAIQFYTNIRPFEPRERDYSVVGSFYVFSVWIGFGVYAIFESLLKHIKNVFLAPLITIICLILVPGILAANNWDDHDRSGKYTTRAMAKKYLESLAPNAILFSIGDNDTFPLWYLQEIEGVRTDVRVINTSLFQTDWYIDQMKRKAYESNPIPSQLTHDKYRGSNRDYIMFREITNDTLLIKDLVNFISSDKPETKVKFYIERQGEDPSAYPKHILDGNYFPSKNFKVPVNKEMVLKKGLVKPKDADKIEPYIYGKISSNAIYKNSLLMLDILANNNWERPIYFTGGAFNDSDYIWLKNHLQLDGLCYKLVPIKTLVEQANPYDMGRIDTEKMYKIIKSWDWGGSGSNIYHDPETRRNSITYRGNIARLIEGLIEEKKFKKAEEMADLAMEKMPLEAFGYYTLLEPYVNAYYQVKNTKKARNLYKKLATKYQEQLIYLSQFEIEKQEDYIDEIYTNIQRYKSLVDLVLIYDEKKYALSQTKTFNSYIKRFEALLEPLEETPEVLPEDNDLKNSTNESINFEPDEIIPQ